MRTQLKRFLRKRKRRAAERIFNNSNLDFNGFKRVYHFHIRKSAGTSVNSAFWALGGLTLKKLKREPLAIGKNFIFVRNNRELIEEGNYHYANSHFPFWALNIPLDTFTFTILRDPYERLVSLYKYYKWVEITDGKTGYKLDTSFYVLKAQKKLLNKSFGEFIDVLSNKYLFGNLYMFSENLAVEEALENLNKVDRVYFQDKLGRSFEDMKETLGLNKIEMPKPQRKFDNSNYDISSDEKEKAISILKKEIDFYNRAREKYNIPK